MNVSPALSPQDESHLNLLSIFHYVFAGLGFFGGLGLLAHYALMNALMNGKLGGSPRPPPAEMVAMMQGMYVVLGFLLLVRIVLNVLAGVFLRQRRNRVFCIVVAALDCLQIPLGTTLGVFTVIVLMRESVSCGYARLDHQN